MTTSVDLSRTGVLSPDVTAWARRSDALGHVWIGGSARAARSGGNFAVSDPSTLEVIRSVADGSVEDATDAVDAAAGAFAAWSAAPPRVRSEVLRRAYELMIAEADRLAALISWENGKSLADAHSEVTYAAEFFRWFSEEAVRSDGDFAIAPTGGTRSLVTSRAVGVAVLVTPWNFPAAMVTRKVAPALAAGCTVVLKPAAETPLSALAVAELLARAGTPQGVVNVVPAMDAPAVVGTLVSDPRVRKLSFTGSTRVGQLLLERAAQRVLNCSMELGGNAPLIVGPDADLARAVDGAMVAKFRNGGQACTAANRLYVHQSLARDFLRAFGERVAGLRVGPSRHEGPDVGPLISPAAVRRVTELVDGALEAGARVAYEADVDPSLDGFFFPPTVLADVPMDAEILEQEIFGPVAPVVTWSDEEELLMSVNRGEYGLASYVFSRDLQWALGVAERLDTGMVGINRGLVSDPAAPFGGVKQSGLGREGAREGLREFQESQFRSIAWA
jgi:succinate-semialdehyde dehydrogenase/glutarate-semialdehyde dehydrogenase